MRGVNYKMLPALDLRLTEENLDDLYENAPCGYCSCLPDGTLVKLNQTLLNWLGYARQELVANQCLQQLLTVGARLHYEMHCVPLLLLQSQVREVSYSLRRKDGGTVPVLLNAVLLRDAEGNPLVIRVTLFDITDRRKYEQELLRTKAQAEEQREQLRAQNEQLTRINADLDSFVYTASHDLKQPVHNLTGLFQEFERSATFHDPAAASMVGMFHEALQQLLSTIDGLTEVVQRQRQLEEAPVEAVLLQPFTEEIIRSLPQQREQPQPVFTLDFAELPTLRMARPALHSVLYNLLSNALKYAEPGRRPRVAVRTAWVEGVPVLSVQDNGRGIDLERHGGALFQLFRRFHPDVTGSGVGLYLVNRLVHQVGGRIDVVSKVGQGTTFRLLMPGLGS
ncbi:sensor histidine kinase [Hymenobacter arizonensis]|uniref:histidine kinase n=1 Tax=Hymenobacter arizonensis TaxID=1227077 RepID=A0A1I5XT88_HYMAR|nr:PAS domain-containing sensor histidine kinase [Hymenobacter arizonensis]SFQ35159.1 PAS domain S-box-containing protein [Hymenobacter arizonensis]